MTAQKSKVVYTAVFGDYDHVPPVNATWDCDFICFTDNPSVVSAGWQVVVVQLDNEAPAQANRRYKMLPHKYLPNYERSLYVDGNIKIVADPSPLFVKYLNNGVVAIPKHPVRDCAYEEALECIDAGYANKKITQQQMARYLAEGFPNKYGLTENRIIFRRHLDSTVINLMADWWKEYCEGGNRDQLSLQYLLWKKNASVILVDESPNNNKSYFKLEIHKIKRCVSIVGRIVDYIRSNKDTNFLLRLVHKFLHKFNRNKFLRKIVK